MGRRTTPVGEIRHVPDKLVDTWTYKVKDVELERLDYVEPEKGQSRRDMPQDEKYRPRKEHIKNKLVTVNIYMVKRTEQSELPRRIPNV